MKVKNALKEGASILQEADVPDAGNDAKLLLSEVTGIRPLDLFLKGDEELSPEAEEKYFSWIALRKYRVPLQAIVGHAAFMGLDFLVSADTLIPRPDTECLCEEALTYLKRGMKVLDLCTGTGCILLSLLALQEGTNGIGSDISAEAVRLAETNRDRLGLIDRAVFFAGDLFSALPGTGEKFDLIVSNPPYIPSGDLNGLMPEVKDFEPARALDGGADGLTFYRRIIDGTPDHLKDGGLLLFEIGCDEGAAVQGLLKEAGFKRIFVKKDYAGNDRVCGAFAGEGPV